MSHAHRPQAPRHRRLRRLLGGVLLLALAGFAAAWLDYRRHWVSTDDAYVTGHLLTLSARTAGTVVEVHVENSQSVKAGDPLVRLDGTRARFAWEEAQAQLGDTVRRIAALYSDVDKYRHAIEARQATLRRLQHDLERYRGAAAEDAIPRQQLQNTEDQIRETEASIQQAQAELAGVHALTDGTEIASHPAVLKSAANLRKAFLEYSRRLIVAPADGYVAKRKVQVGDEVHEGSPLLAIVPLEEVWVEANLRERDLGRVRSGQPAEVSVDMPGHSHVYQGRVEGIHPGTGSLFALLPPENTSGNFIHITERVPVRIALAPEELRRYPLRQGLSTITRIRVGDGEKPLLASDVTARHPANRTAVYDREGLEAERQIDEIIRRNARPRPTSTASR